MPCSDQFVLVLQGGSIESHNFFLIGHQFFLGGVIWGRAISLLYRRIMLLVDSQAAIYPQLPLFHIIEEMALP